MSDLVAFLRARLDEDEQVARAAIDDGDSGSWQRDKWPSEDGVVDSVSDEIIVYDESRPTSGQAEHIARHDPARVLAEVEAMRAIVDWLDQLDEYAAERNLWDLDTASPRKLIAAIWADHEDYQEEWAL